MLKKILLLLLTLTILFSYTTTFAREYFLDVPEDDWVAPYIYDLYDRGIINGYGDGYYGRDDKVLRCEYAKMIVNISEVPIIPSSASPYADVPVSEWYFPYVTASMRYMTGFQLGDGTLVFDPNAAARREDVTVAIVKALNIDLSEYENYEDFLSQKFSDYDQISSHNRKYIAAAVEKGIITGDQVGTFRPDSPITRAEVAIVLQRAFPNGNIIKQ